LVNSASVRSLVKQTQRLAVVGLILSASQQILAQDDAASASARNVIEERILGDRGEAGSFDLIFIDADKGNYPYYLDAACKLLKSGGLLLGDNAYWEGKVVDASARDVETEAIRLFNRRLAEDPRFDGVLLPVRDGLAVARFNGTGVRSPADSERDEI